MVNSVCSIGSKFVFNSNPIGQKKLKGYLSSITSFKKWWQSFHQYLERNDRYPLFFFTFTFMTVLAVAFRSPILFNKWFTVCIVSVTMWQYLELIMYLSYLVLRALVLLHGFILPWSKALIIKGTYIFQKLQGVKRLCDQNFILLVWHEDSHCK